MNDEYSTVNDRKQKTPSCDEVEKPNNLDAFMPQDTYSQKGGSDSETSRTRLQVSS